MNRQTGKLFYGWIIVAVLFLVCMVPMVFISNFSSYYQVPISTEFHCNYVVFNISQIASSVSGMVFSLTLAGRLGKGDTKRWMVACGILAAVVLMVQSCVTSIWQFCITRFCLDFAFSGMTYIPINTLLARWFVDKKGTATSIVFIGTGVGGMVFSSVLAGILETMGWRASYRITAAATLAVSLLIALLVRNYPSDLGLEPYRESGNKAFSSAAPAENGTAAGLTKKEAVKTAAFWFYAATVFCVGILSAGIITQVPTYLIENGLDYAKIMILYNAAALVVKLILGAIYDKKGIEAGVSISALCTILCLICLFLVPHGAAFAFAGAVLLAFNCLSTYVMPLMNGRIFGYKEFSQIYGFANVFFMGGCMIGPILSASIRTATGSYGGAWVVNMAVMATCWICMFAGLKAGKKLLRPAETESRG